MNKEERIKRYGEEKYEEMMEQKCIRQKSDEYRKNIRKGGKHYKKILKYQQTGLQGDKGRIRMIHANKWREFKKIIAPQSEIHHEWIPKVAKYRSIALVDKTEHRHNLINPIYILNGEITLRGEI